MEPENSVIPQFIHDNLFIFAIGVGGMLLLVYGVFHMLKPQEGGVVIEKAQSRESKITAEDSATPTSTKKLIVDIEGAVVNPGLYSLPLESRQQDAITAAGGFNEKADHEVIARSMNLAARLSDGMKLYIPSVGEQPLTSSGEQGVAGVSTGNISINSASSSELDSLPGVGQVTATKIIQNRPYNSLEELLTKKIVSKSTYEKIKDLITL